MSLVPKREFAVSIPGTSPVLSDLRATPTRRSVGRGHTAPRAPIISLDQPGRLRLANVIALLGISHSTFCAGLKPRKKGDVIVPRRYPPPDGYDGKFPWWRTDTIKAFLDA